MPRSGWSARGEMLALNSSYVSIILARSTVADPAAAVITLAKTAAIHT